MTDLATLAIEIRTDGSARATRDLHNVERASKQTEKAVDSLSLAVNALKRLMALGIGIQGISGFLQMADTMQSLRTQVKFVTGSLAELNKVQSELFDISQRTRASLESTTQLYVRTSRALKDYGVSQRQVLQFTETINKAMAVGGVGAQEQASALMQLSQALGSGRLQGDEFKTIAETAPIILDVVAEYMGKSREEVKKLASEGQITSKLLFEAINSSTKKINQQFAEMPLTFGQAMQQMQNAAMKFVGDLNQSTNATNLLAQGVSFLAENFNTLGAIVGGLMLAHLAKYGQSMAMVVVNGHKQSLVNLQIAKTAQAKATAELGAAQANMAVLASELRLAQTEQTRSVLRARMAQQATLITSLTNAQRVATDNLAAAQTRASIAGRALSGVMGLLGGPAGVITLAAGALFYFYQESQNAKQAALDVTGANERLKQSYDDLSKASLMQQVQSQVQLLKDSEKQIKSLQGQISMLEVPDSFTGQVHANKEEVAKLTKDLERMTKTENINFSVLEKQLSVLAVRFVENGSTLSAFKDEMEAMGISQERVNSVLNQGEVQLSAVKAEIQRLYPQIDAASISYDGLNLKIGDFSIKADIASVKASGLTDTIGSLGRTVLLAAAAMATLNKETGGGAISEKAQSEIDRLKKQTQIVNLKRKGDTKGARQLESELKAETMGYDPKSADFKALVENLNTLSEAQENFSESKKAARTAASESKKALAEAKKAGEKAKREQEEWSNHYNELERASADTWTKIALEEQRSMREMLEKAKKANVGYEEIENRQFHFPVRV